LFVGQRDALGVERRNRLGQLRDLLRDARFAVARECELLLEPCHFRIRRVETALLLMERVARRIVLDAQRFEIGFGRPHIGLQCVKGGRQRCDLGGTAFSTACGILLLCEPQHLLRLLEATLELAVFGRDFRLLAQARELIAELLTDVFDAREILAGVGEAAFGFLAALAVLGNAGGFLEEDTKVFRLCLHDTADHSLLDDRVGARAEAGTQEEIVDIAAPNRDVVDVVAGIAVAREETLDRQLGVLTPLSADPPFAVIEGKLDRRAPDRLAIAGAVENHVLHRFAAQRRCFRFAEHPPDGVDDVRLAAAVGTDDADELARRRNRRRIDERFETGELDLGEAQGLELES
jgi:hypothetical protein